MIRYGVVQEKVADKTTEQQVDTKEPSVQEDSETAPCVENSQVKETDK